MQPYKGNNINRKNNEGTTWKFSDKVSSLFDLFSLASSHSLFPLISGICFHIALTRSLSQILCKHVLRLAYLTRSFSGYNLQSSNALKLEQEMGFLTSN